MKKQVELGKGECRALATLAKIMARIDVDDELNASDIAKDLLEVISDYPGVSWGALFSKLDVDGNPRQPKDGFAARKEKFVDYVLSFYGPGQMYGIGATREMVSAATDNLISLGHDVAFDSIDREKVREIILGNNPDQWAEVFLNQGK